jgi:DNA-directed RNA polymerase subunit N (RpoN/RPB10)
MENKLEETQQNIFDHVDENKVSWYKSQHKKHAFNKQPEYNPNNILHWIDLPIRCFTCNKLLSNLCYDWLEIESELIKNKFPEDKIKLEIMNRLNIPRMCCRMIMLSNDRYVKQY